MRVFGRYKQIIRTLGFTLLLNACNLDKVDPEYPDLVIVPNPAQVPPLDYCNTSGENLVVTVKNIGLSTSDTSTTRVEFVTGLLPFELVLLESIRKPTPVLLSGESISLLFKIPPECFDPDCEFYIAVDVLNNVSETDEGNNGVTGTCEE